MVAFALTLLVLQVKVPLLSQVVKHNSAADLAAQLAGQASQLTSYVIAFYIIAQFWLTHHRVFHHMAGHQEGLAWWNFAFLFTIPVMPFTTSPLGDYPGNPLAIDIFAANLLPAILATRVTLLFGRRRHLLSADIDAGEMQALARAAATVFVVALLAGLAWVNPTAAKFCWLLIPSRSGLRSAGPRAPPLAPARPVHRETSPQPADRRRRPQVAVGAPGSSSPGFQARPA